ncbi:single-stranded DNA-binding protein [Mycoplasma sp. P36-A1]|uniref:single-stranded DNA-binding protein n=1 Tax=Mycoplasma sp. P36-A1 TaxID=3252900 RepID=UPI003C2B2766
MNRTVLSGRITRDLELKKTQSGRSFINFTIAVNRTFTNQSGEREADFISCIAWGKPAETMATYLAKGSLIGVDGRIQTRNYDDANGRRVYITEVVVENFEFLESRAASANNRTSSYSNQQQPQQSTRPAPAASAPQNDFFADFENSNSSNDILSSLDISDDELPF